MAEYSPRVGDIGVVRTTGWAARFIQLGTESKWNHAFIYVGDNGNGFDIVEATPHGVQYGHSSEYTDIAYNKHQVFNNEEVDRAFIANYVRALVGKPYNWIDIARLIFRILGLRFFSNTKLMKHLSEKDGYICSEMCDEAYEKSGNTLSSKDSGITTPGDLIKVMVYQ